MSQKLLIALSMVVSLTLKGSGVTAGPLNTFPPQQPQPLVIAGSPLTLQVGSNASIQIFHENYDSGQVFGDADSGIFLWVNGLLYGSNLAGTHTVTAANVTLPFTTLSHGGPTGSGTIADPWVITTILQVEDTGLEVEQRASYANGQEYFRIDWQITNHSSTNIEFDFFHAADLYFADSDFGYGYFDPASGGVGGADEAHTWFMMFVPSPKPTHYQEAGYSTIWNNIGACFDAECILGPGFDDTVLTADYLDNGVGLQWHRSLGPEESTEFADWWSFGTSPVVPPEAQGKTEFISSIPTPDRVSLDPEVVATNFLLASFFALLFAILSTIFNNTLQQNQGEINHLLFGRLPSLRPRLEIPLAMRRLAQILAITLFLFLTGLINSFLDPTFQPLSLQGIGIFLSMLLSIGFINLLFEGTKVLSARGLGLDAAFRLHPLGILIAIVCVLLSRAVDFLPGYLFGVLGGLVLTTAAVSRGRMAFVSTAGLGMLLLFGLGFWILTIPLSSLFSSTASLPSVQSLFITVQSFFLLIFLVALETVFLELLPLAVTSGTDIFNWNKIFWFLLFLPIFFLFYHIFLNPNGAYFAGVTNRNTLLLAFLLLVFGLITLGVWLFFRLRRAAESDSP